MSDGSKIEWTDATWNPITGCSVTSPGCANCYAMRLAGTRLRDLPSRAGLTVPSKAGPVWNGQVRFNEAWLDQPLRWKRPRKIFVCAHGDLFHEAVPEAWIDRVFAVMALAPQHSFQVLTKRAERMRHYMAELVNGSDAATLSRLVAAGIDRLPIPERGIDLPFANVWLGVSAEDQTRADERVPHLLATPAATRFLSAEPLLGPIDLVNLPSVSGIGRYLDALSNAGAEDSDVPTKLDWIIVGGESGSGARPMHPAWARQLRDDCVAAGVPFFFKQWGDWIDEPQATAQGCAPGDDMFGADGMPRGDRWHFYDGDDIAGGAAIRIGKRRAGALLDGREWRELPQ